MMRVPRGGLGRVFCIAALALVAAAFAALARAQPAQQPAPKPEITQSCPGLVAKNWPRNSPLDQPRALPAAFQLAALNPDQVRITYVGHATFLIESPQLVRIATDYNDYVRSPVTPDIITMNHAHR